MIERLATITTLACVDKFDAAPDPVPDFIHQWSIEFLAKETGLVPLVESLYGETPDLGRVAPDYFLDDVEKRECAFPDSGTWESDRVLRSQIRNWAPRRVMQSKLPEEQVKNHAAQDEECFRLHRDSRLCKWISERTEPESFTRSGAGTAKIVCGDRFKVRSRW